MNSAECLELDAIRDGQKRSISWCRIGWTRVNRVSQQYLTESTRDPLPSYGPSNGIVRRPGERGTKTVRD